MLAAQLRPRRRARGAILAALALVLMPAACESGSSGASRAGAADTLMIGIAASRTAVNEAYFVGARLAIAELNRRRPPGAPAFALAMPPEAQPTQVAVAAGFRDDARVVGVVGHTGSAQTMEAAPIYGDAEQGGRRAVVAVSPTSTNPAVTRGSEWVFRVCPTDLDAAAALAAFAADSLDSQRVAIIYRNDLFGRGFSRRLTSELERHGRRVSERDPYLAGITEYVAYAQRIARSGADVLVVAGGSGDAGDMIRAVRAAGGRPHILGTDDVAGLAADTASTREFRGVRYTAFFLAERATTIEARRFVDAYRARTGVAPDHRAALTYDATMLIGTAAQAVGPDRRAIRDWIAGVGRQRPAFQGVTGAIRFDEEGDAVGKVVLVGQVGA